MNFWIDRVSIWEQKLLISCDITIMKYFFSQFGNIKGIIPLVLSYVICFYSVYTFPPF